MTQHQDPLPYGRLAEVYDAAYHFVDYAAAAAYVRTTIRANRPTARSLLEVGCGTGRYLELFAPDFVVEGLDLSEQMLAKARARLPDVPLHQGDMASFSLGRRYDVVCCLFRSIGYVQTVERLEAAISTMAGHLAPDGLLLVEPFFTPDTYRPNVLTLNEHTSAGFAIAWMYLSERTETGARFRINFLVGRPTGIEHFVEVHDFGLFTFDDFCRAFAAAGLSLEYMAATPGGTGMYLGRRS